MSKSNRKVVAEMLEYADHASDLMLKEMTSEQALEMVRDFTKCLIEWQPNIAEFKDDHVTLGLACLSTAHLFMKAFGVAYEHTDKTLQAKEAIKKARGDL